MKAMVLQQITSFSTSNKPLKLMQVPKPEPGTGEILIRVSTCGVCHTELDEIEGRSPPSQLPMILGHQVVGRVVQKGPRTERFEIDDRVGVAWINSACGHCPQCTGGAENLCDQFRATGRDALGGYAEFTTVSQDFAYEIPQRFTDSQAAPLLCAGAIGYRSLHLTGLKDGQVLGLTGFGASAHLVLKMVRHKFANCKIFVFARSRKEQEFALELGAHWAGDTDSSPPEEIDCIIDTTPAWKPIVAALANLKSGGRLVVNAIRKEDTDKSALLEIDYPRHLWMEKEIKSVANVARRDVREFLDLAAEIPIIAEIQEFALEEANQALAELKNRKIRGAKVLKIED